LLQTKLSLTGNGLRAPCYPGACYSHELWPQRVSSFSYTLRQLLEVQLGPSEE